MSDRKLKSIPVPLLSALFVIFVAVMSFCNGIFALLLSQFDITRDLNSLTIFFSTFFMIGIGTIVYAWIGDNDNMSDKELWLMVRRALKMIVAAIERKYMVKDSEQVELKPSEGVSVSHLVED